MQNKPISRSMAIAQSSVEVEKAVNDIVGVINKKLVNFVDGSSAYVEVGQYIDNLQNDVWMKVKARVIELYKAEGWKISYNSGSQFDECSQFDIS